LGSHLQAVGLMLQLSPHVHVCACDVRQACPAGQDTPTLLGCVESTWWLASRVRQQGLAKLGSLL
jgi:hypothetical protein